MAYVRRETVSITTDGSGDAIGYTAVVNGFIRGARYVKTDYADGVDFVISGEATGQPILTAANVNASVSWHPRQGTHAAADASAALYASGGEAVNSDIPIGPERVKIVVDEGGDTKTGTFYIWVG